MSTDRSEYEDNRKWWSERANYHLQTPMYREFVQRLREGADALLPFDDRVLGDLDGSEVLHLQCHVGTDTLSLARRGASITGVDFSPDALAQARRLSKDLDIPARFVEADAAHLPDDLRGPFDLAYTSYGALCWLPDLEPWARGIANRLRPGGRLIVIDGHPLWSARSEAPPSEASLVLDYPYLGASSPHKWTSAGSYADRDASTTHNAVHEWFHGLGEIVSVVLDAGLTVEELTEHPEDYCQGDDTMARGEDRLWRLPKPLHGRYPLTFTLVARKA